jgi:acetyl esterase/lipase
MRSAAACILVVLGCAAPAQAHAAPAKAGKIKPVSYGKSSRETLRPFPSAKAGSPTVILVPGGGFKKVETGLALPEAKELQAAGITVMLANYPVDTAKKPAFPLEPEAIARAIAYTKQHAATYNGSTTRVFLVGGSAGGALVLSTALKLAGVRGVVSMSGPTDFYARAQEHEPMRQALGCLSTPCSKALADEWSPVDNIASCTPMLLFGSEHDEVPLSEQVEMVEAMEAKSCPVTLEVEPTGHSFGYRELANPGIISFINAH